ncbi:hypothetical protein MSC49_03950 [Methylosinus sp. C49]|uniref:energy transducer TonB n=1 Tax=Methylosinus sp. C49 TaxID=2699395 RepID=UPI00136731DF|nr:TonB family protein [Methylosinus sp. C49]BBU60460.1 hypothetical protein MSC49_03950 [Methylosinus sp. C49]
MTDETPREVSLAARSRAHEETVLPAWLRPLAIGVALGAHAAILIGFIAFVVDKPTPLEDVRVELVPQGETVTETSVSRTPDAAPTFALDPTPAATPDPTLREDPDVAKPKERASAETVDLLSAPLPQMEASDAVEQPPIENAQKSWRRVEEKKRKEEMEEARRQAAQRVACLEQARARQQAAHSQSGAAAVREGAGDAPRMSNAAYAALVSAEINRHKHYPPSARERGATGSVGVVFSIGPSGAVTSHAITRSSGNGAIDAAVHQMLAVSRPPRQTGGYFRGSVVISFDLSR